VTNGAGQTTSATVTLTVNAVATATSYRRSIVGLFTGSYGQGCTSTVGATGPIVIGADGEIRWGGGALSMAGNLVSVSAQNNFISGSNITELSTHDVTVSGAGAANSLGLRLNHGDPSQTNARIADASSQTVLICLPGIAGATAHKPIVELAASWWAGVTADMRCTVRQGASEATQTLTFSVVGKTVRLGALELALDSRRQTDLVRNAPIGALEASLGERVLFTGLGYAGTTSITMFRYSLARNLELSWDLSSGERYSCVGNRNP
jgi:hypothetical protein